MGHWIKLLGVVLIFAGVTCRLASIGFIAPGRSRFAVLARGSFQKKDDYTPTGWHVYKLGFWVALAGFIVVVTAVYVFNG